MNIYLKYFLNKIQNITLKFVKNYFMKYKILLLCAISFFSFSAKSQITITRADMPCPIGNNFNGDSVIYTNVPVAQNTIDVNTTGQSSVWNTVPLVNGTQAYQNFLPLNQTPIIFQLVFLGSDYAQPLLGNQNIAGLPLTDAYEYYNYAGNDTRLEIKGFGANINLQGTTLPLPGIYTSPDVLYRFPMQYGNSDSSSSGYSVAVPPGGSPIATIKRTQTRVNNVDGWGSITTPAGTFDVLRVKSEINRVDSVITIFPLGVPSNIIEYKWIGNSKKIPVMQVTGNVIANNYTPTAITFWGFDPLSYHDNIVLNADINIYPNPSVQKATIQFSLQTNSDVMIEIYSINGRRIAHFHYSNLQSGLNKEILPMHLLNSGTYFVKCTAKNETLSSKFIKL